MTPTLSHMTQSRLLMFGQSARLNPAQSAPDIDPAHVPLSRRTAGSFWGVLFLFARVWDDLDMDERAIAAESMAILSARLDPQYDAATQRALS